MTQVEYLIKYRMDVDKRRNINYSKSESSAVFSSASSELTRYEENGSPTIHYIAQVEGTVSKDPGFLLQEGNSFFNRKDDRSSNVYGFL